MLFLSLSFLALAFLPFGYKRWRRQREFQKIRKDIMKWTDGNDLGFTYERYQQNRAGFLVSYVHPVLTFVPAFICSAATIPVSNASPSDMKNGIVIMSGIVIIHLIVMVKEFFKRNEEPKIDLYDVVSRSDLGYMTRKNETLETSVFLHKMNKVRNENSLLLIQNKEYLKNLVYLPSIIEELDKIEEGLSFLKKIKGMFSHSDYTSKQEQLKEGLKDFRDLLHRGIHSTLVAIGKEKTVEQEKEEELSSKKNLNQLLKEEEPETIALPVPILELQALVETSVDEDIKKKAQEALALANQLFEESKKRNEESAKDFVRMKQQAVIDAALQEMQKY